MTTSRSGTSRSYAERKERGQPNVTLSLPAKTVQILAALAGYLGKSRSGLVADLIDEAFRALSPFQRGALGVKTIEAAERKTSRKRAPKNRT